jgi:prepilin-type N-terminal cleavage/methylation domain-containing protein
MALENIKQQRKDSGFTIVELLIVIVVIAILATISIVAYTGIQNRAKTSAGNELASQVLKKFEAANAI